MTLIYKVLRTMNEILGTRINIKFCKSKLGLEINKINVTHSGYNKKYKIYYVSYRHNINLLFI